jgi:hypothetical protein
MKIYLLYEVKGNKPVVSTIKLFTTYEKAVIYRKRYEKKHYSLSRTEFEVE